MECENEGSRAKRIDEKSEERKVEELKDGEEKYVKKTIGRYGSDRGVKNTNKCGRQERDEEKEEESTTVGIRGIKE